MIYDIASSTLIETVQAHTSTVCSMHVRSDGEALVTGSADKDVKFWSLEYKKATDESVSTCWFLCFYLDIDVHISAGSKREAFIAGSCSYSKNVRRGSVREI